MNETVAISVAVFESVKAKAYRAHLKMVAEMSRRIEPDNLWLLNPDWERRTYPFCVQGMVMEMFEEEDRRGKKADWFFWLEDDIIPDPDIFFTLRASADPEERPYVAALAYCRARPYFPGVASVEFADGMVLTHQWENAPSSGVHPVDRVGMCAAIFHRSLFDRIPEPWFNVHTSTTRGLGPDVFWCRNLQEQGIQPYLCCDAKVGHISEPIVINQEMSEKWNAYQKV